MRTIMYILIAAVAITSIVSGFIMINDPNGGVIDLSTGILESTPFNDFVIPGILLLTVVGSVNLIANSYKCMGGLRALDYIITFYYALYTAHLPFSW